MEQMSAEMAARIASAANRLRLIQIDLAEEPEVQRRKLMLEQVERELKTLEPDQRGRFLAGLTEMFPTWDQVRLTEDAPDAPTESAGDARDYNDPFFLVDRLTHLADTLSDTQRRAVIKLLDEAGLVARREGGWSAESEANFRQMLHISDDEEIDGDRVMEQHQMLVTAMRDLDRVVWQTWRLLTANAGSANGSQLMERMRSFASGSHDTSATEMHSAIEQLRARLGALIMAVGQVGEQFASRWANRLAPHEIEATARQEPKPITLSWEVAFWRKYKDIAQGLDQRMIEKEVREAIREYVEVVMHGALAGGRHGRS